jgi:hypothetical protein
MKQKTKRYLLIIAILIGGFFLSKLFFISFRNTDTIANKIGCSLFELNKIKVTVGSEIQLNDIEVKVGNKIVFCNGKQVNRVGQEYGHTIMSIYYKEQLVAEVGHFKSNNWYTNDYNFFIKKEIDQIIVQHKIEGPNAKYDNFQKRYVYNIKNELLRIDYLTENNKIYNSKTIKK